MDEPCEPQFASDRLRLITGSFFLIIICSCPLVQMMGELITDREELPTAFRLLRGLAKSIESPSPFQNKRVFARLKAWNQRLIEEFRAYEIQVVEQAWPLFPLRDLLQSQLAGSFRTGNDQVIVGNQDWLFFSQDLKAVAGPGFLKQSSSLSTPSGALKHSSPLLAIKKFRDDLRDRGIHLLLLPVPSKASFMADRYLIPHFAGAGRDLAKIRRNVSFVEFAQQLNDLQIEWLDISETLQPAAPTEDPYLRGDTHWSPAAMQRVANRVAEELTTHFRIQKRQEQTATRQPVRVSNLGDTTRLLLASTAIAGVRWKQEVTYNRVSQGSGVSPTDRESPILLLGDSFTNIYSDVDLGWGTQGGLVEQLSYCMRLPVESISQNAGGPQGTRQELTRRIQNGSDPLAGKSVVIWQFAERELSTGDWEIIPLPSGASDSGPQKTVLPRAGAIVEGTIQQISQVPDIRKTPYRDCLIALHLRKVQSLNSQTINSTDIVVFVLGIEGGKTLPSASWRPGQRVALEIEDWSLVEATVGRIARIELDDPDFTLIDLPTYFGTFR